MHSHSMILAATRGDVPGDIEQLDSDIIIRDMALELLDSDPLTKYVGRVVGFACHPYHYGTLRITGVEAHTSKWATTYTVHGVAVEATETSRLFQHTTKRSIAGRTFKLYGLPLYQLEAGELSFTYPV